MTKTEFLLELLFPPRCIMCGGVIPIGDVRCEGCGGDFARLRLEDDDNDLTGAPERESGSLDGVCASFLYESPISDAVARYKFRGERALAREFAAYMAEDFKRVFGGARCDVALGAPSYERRNDHAERLAQSCAKRLGVKYDGGLLVKTRATDKQHELSAAQRAVNLKSAFEARAPERLRGKAVLLVDDVTTSGATLNECAKTLRAAGAREVYALCFCATLKRL